MTALSTIASGTTNPAATAANAAARAATSNTSLGQADFLRLLTAQMTQQDPLNPLDNTAFVAQMAQFSQVSGLAEINQSLSAISSLLRGNASGSLAGWIGHNALVDGGQAMPLEDGQVHGMVTLNASASDATLTLTDATGTIVATEQLGDVPAGEHGFAITPPQGATGPFSVGIVSPAETPGAVISNWTTIVGVRSPGAGADARLITMVGDADPASIRRIG